MGLKGLLLCRGLRQPPAEEEDEEEEAEVRMLLFLPGTSSGWVCFPVTVDIPYNSDFQPVSSHGTHKLITPILRHTKKWIFCRSDKKNNFDLFTLDGSCIGC